VRPDCADDVFAIRLSHVTQTELLDALRATERLSVDATDNGFRLSRRKDYFDQGRSLLERYYGRLFENVFVPMEAAAQKVSELATLPDSDRGQSLMSFWDASEAKKKVDPQGFDIAKLTYGCLGPGDIPFAALITPKKLAEQGSRGVGKVVYTTIDDEPSTFFPSGKRDLLLPFRRVPEGLPGPPTLAASKLTVEPLTGGTVFRMLFGYPDDKFGLAFIPTLTNLRHSNIGTASVETVFSRSEMAAYRARLKATESAVHVFRGEQTVTVRKGTLRVSEALIDVAEKADENLIAYVSPLSDHLLNTHPERSLKSVIEDVNRADFDPASEHFIVQQVLHENYGPPPANTVWASVSGHRAGPVLVCRTETDFLDTLVNGPAGLSSLVENEAIKGSAPLIADVTQTIAAMKLSAWNGSIFSWRLFRYVDPTAMFPFARAMAVSPSLCQAVEALADKGSVEIAFNDLERPARREFELALQQAGERNDFASTFDPIFVSDSVRRGGLLPHLAIRFARDGQRYSFDIIDPGTKRVDWHAWMNNVQPVAPH